MKISKQTVEAIAPGARDVYGWDDKIPGFGVKVTPPGSRIYVLKYRFDRAQRWITIGRHGDLTATQARAKAMRLRGSIAEGKDPASVRDERAAASTVNELAEHYLEQHARTNKAARSVEEDERNLRLHVLPILGHRRAVEVTEQDIASLHHSMRATRVAANRVRALLSKMFALAEDWGIRARDTNPVRVKPYAEQQRDRFLSGDELGRLDHALNIAQDNGEHPCGIAIIRLLLLTGCRRNEILSLELSSIDLANGCLRLPTSKTGPKVVHLGAAAIELLERLPRIAGSKYLFPRLRSGAIATRKTGAGHYIGIERLWQRVRARAGLDGVPLHTLRHTFASWAVMGGDTLHMTGKLLGHSQASTTERYAHLAANPMREAADRVSGRLAAMMAGKT
jgi:integrase